MSIDSVLRTFLKQQPLFQKDLYSDAYVALISQSRKLDYRDCIAILLNIMDEDQLYLSSEISIRYPVVEGSVRDYINSLGESVSVTGVSVYIDEPRTLGFQANITGIIQGQRTQKGKVQALDSEFRNLLDLSTVAEQILRLAYRLPNRDYYEKLQPKILAEHTITGTLVTVSKH